MMTNEDRIAMIDALIKEAVNLRAEIDGSATAMRLTQAALNAAHAYKTLDSRATLRLPEEL